MRQCYAPRVCYVTAHEYTEMREECQDYDTSYIIYDDRLTDGKPKDPDRINGQDRSKAGKWRNEIGCYVPQYESVTPVAGSIAVRGDELELLAAIKARPSFVTWSAITGYWTSYSLVTLCDPVS
jgi:hypothetical protein